MKQSPPFSPRRSRGFTLIETMVVVVVAGVLSSVVYPSLASQVLRARRTDALVALLQAQLGEERFRANNTRYGSAAEIGLRGTSTAGYYTIELSASDAEHYDVLASATGLQARDADCRHLRLSLDGDTVIFASGADAATRNATALNRKCWNQ